MEFALTFPILLMIVLGIFEFGRLLWIYTSVTTASREAARYGSTVGLNSLGVEHFLDCQGIRDIAKQFGGPGQVTDADVDIWYDHGPGTASIGNCDDPVPDEDISLGDRVVVEVTGHFVPAPAIPLFDIPSFTIDSAARRTIIRGASME